ncbi:MAG: hypothetical protein AAF467_07880 [Actinomycetota bacterium]
MFLSGATTLIGAVVAADVPLMAASLVVLSGLLWVAWWLRAGMIKQVLADGVQDVGEVEQCWWWRNHWRIHATSPGGDVTNSVIAFRRPAGAGDRITIGRSPDDLDDAFIVEVWT